MYAVRRPVENVYLVRERDRRRTRELFALVLAALPPLAVLVVAVWANIQTRQYGYQIQQATERRRELHERRRQLLADRAAAASLRDVEKVAREKLHLETPRPEQVILVRDGTLAAASGAPPAPPAASRPPAALEGPPAPRTASTEEGF